jgi:hypothetical protein
MRKVTLTAKYDFHDFAPFGIPLAHHENGREPASASSQPSASRPRDLFSSLTDSRRHANQNLGSNKFLRPTSQRLQTSAAISRRSGMKMCLMSFSIRVVTSNFYGRLWNWRGGL